MNRRAFLASLPMLFIAGNHVPALPNSSGLPKGLILRKMMMSIAGAPPVVNVIGVPMGYGSTPLSEIPKIWKMKYLQSTKEWIKTDLILGKINGPVV